MHLCEHTQPDTCSITGLWTLSMWPTVFLLAENLIHQRHPAKLTLKFFGFSNWMWICCYLKNSECWWWTKTPNNCWWQDLSWTLLNQHLGWRENWKLYMNCLHKNVGVCVLYQSKRKNEIAFTIFWFFINYKALSSSLNWVSWRMATNFTYIHYYVLSQLFKPLKVCHVK